MAPIEELSSEVEVAATTKVEVGETGEEDQVVQQEVEARTLVQILQDKVIGRTRLGEDIHPEIEEDSASRTSHRMGTLRKHSSNNS